MTEKIRAAMQAAWSADRCFRCAQDLSSSRIYRVPFRLGRSPFGGRRFVVDGEECPNSAALCGSDGQDAQPVMANYAVWLGSEQ